MALPTHPLSPVWALTGYVNNADRAHVVSPLSFMQPTWNNTRYNARYIPSYVPATAARRAYPILTNYPRITSQGVSQSYPSQSSPTQPQLQQQQPQQRQQYQQQQQPYYSAPEENPRQQAPPHHQPPINHYGSNANVDDGLNLTTSLHPNNEYETNPQSYPGRSVYGQQRNPAINRGLTYATNDQAGAPPPPPPPHGNQRRRVQIADNSRQTPSTVINDYGQGKNSRNSNPTPTYSNQTRTPEPTFPQQRHRPPAGSIPPSSSVSHQRRDHSDDTKNGNNGNIHEYLYGLAAPDPGLKRISPFYWSRHRFSLFSSLQVAMSVPTKIINVVCKMKDLAGSPWWASTKPLHKTGASVLLSVIQILAPTKTKYDTILMAILREKRIERPV